MLEPGVLGGADAVLSHDFHVQETGHMPLGHTLLDADGVPVFTAVREGRRHG